MKLEKHFSTTSRLFSVSGYDENDENQPTQSTGSRTSSGDTTYIKRRFYREIFADANEKEPSIYEYTRLYPYSGKKYNSTTFDKTNFTAFFFPASIRPRRLLFRHLYERKVITFLAFHIISRDN